MEKYTSDRLSEYFTNYIKKQVETEINKINLEAQSAKNDYISSVEGELTHKYNLLFDYEKNKKETALINKKRLISNDYLAKYNKLRTEYVTEIYNKVLDIVSVHKKSEEYKNLMISKINEVKKMKINDFVFSINVDDKILSSILDKEGFKYETTNKIIAGFSCISNSSRILIDETFRTKLNSIIDNVYEVFGEENE
jgi:vacuolar-type H+-ATPase subunit E/Vma4